jgi:hypothetical protein
MNPSDTCLSDVLSVQNGFGVISDVALMLTMLLKSGFFPMALPPETAIFHVAGKFCCFLFLSRLDFPPRRYNFTAC